jgi:glycine/D-amino acid oxidase-like deaminating enzyme
MSHAQIVICGAGIAGITVAHRLALHHGWNDIVLVDERAPLSLTSDKSTEAYRNWWPGPDDAMARCMDRSIDLMEEIAASCANRIRLNRRGYLYVTSNPARLTAYQTSARQAETMGIGPLRSHYGKAGDPPFVPAPLEGYAGAPPGADLFLDAQQLHRLFPFLAEHTCGALYARRCGWLSGQQLGMVMLEQAKAAGVRLLTGRVASIYSPGGRVSSVTVATAGGSEVISTPLVVNAAGPFLGHVGQLMGLELPIFSELHLKIAFEDRIGAIPRNAPFTIYDDPMALPWSDDEREELLASGEATHLLARFPAGLHFRPEGGPGAETVLMLWAYHVDPVEPRLPVPLDPEFPEIVIRGMSHLVPALAPYLARLPKCYTDGGYYTKTKENRPLIGPLPLDGAFVCGAYSGYGIMAACAGAELLAAHITGDPLPAYAKAFHPARYDDPVYRTRLQSWGETGQL